MEADLCFVDLGKIVSDRGRGNGLKMNHVQLFRVEIASLLESAMLQDDLRLTDLPFGIFFQFEGHFLEEQVLLIRSEKLECSQGCRC